jgi:hypothetical protein
LTRHTVADMRLACANCGQPFIFSAGEQELQQLRGICQTPRYCRPCAQQARGSGRELAPAHVPADSAGAPPGPSPRAYMPEFSDEPTHIHIARRRPSGRVVR